MIPQHCLRLKDIFYELDMAVVMQMKEDPDHGFERWENVETRTEVVARVKTIETG